MKITNIALFAVAALAFTACAGAKDTGETGSDIGSDGAADGAADGAGDGGGSTTDSCDWSGIGLCIEFVNYAGTEGWCTDIGAQYGIDTAYANTPCGGGSVGSCDITDVAGDDYPADATVYYYSEFSNDPAASCADAGGSYN